MERTAYIYEVCYCNADFDNDHVVIEAESKEEADKLVDIWCRGNNCTNSDSATGLGPKARLMYNAFIVPRRDSFKTYSSLIPQATFPPRIHR